MAFKNYNPCVMGECACEWVCKFRPHIFFFKNLFQKQEASYGDLSVVGSNMLRGRRIWRINKLSVYTNRWLRAYSKLCELTEHNFSREGHIKSFWCTTKYNNTLYTCIYVYRHIRNTYTHRLPILALFK